MIKQGIFFIDPMQNQTNMPTLLAMLSDEEQIAARGIELEQERRIFVIGRAYLRHLLSQCMGCNPVDVPITLDVAGDPFLPDGKIHFDLSQTRRAVFIAIASQRRIGVAIEQSDQQTEIQIGSPDPGLDRSIWCRKRAIEKASGMRLDPMRLSDIDLSADNFTLNQQHLRLFNLRQIPLLVGAVAMTVDPGENIPGWGRIVVQLPPIFSASYVPTKSRHPTGQTKIKTSGLSL